MVARYYNLEGASTDDLLLEDGSGKYLLEVIEDTLIRHIRYTRSIIAHISGTADTLVLIADGLDAFIVQEDYSLILLEQGSG